MPKMKAAYEDIEKLIELVRQTPSLYDPAHREYKDSLHSENHWNEIAKQMGRSDMTGSDWRKKWINRRDTYVKKKRLIRTSQTPLMVEQAKRWRFFQALTFLDRFCEGSSDSVEYKALPMSAGNEDDSSDGISGDEDSYESTNLLRRPKAELGKKRPQSFSPFTTHSSSNINNKRKVDNDIESDTALYSALPISFPVTHNTINNDTHHDEPHGSISIGNSSTLLSQSQVDPIAMSVGHHFGQQSECESPPLTGHHMVSPGYHALFQSYAHRMERLSSDRTRSFLQLQIAQLFFNAENPDLPPVPIMPLPRHSSSSSSTRQSSSHQRQEHHEQDQQTQKTQQTEASSADQQTGRSGDIEHSANGKVPIKIENL